MKIAICDDDKSYLEILEYKIKKALADLKLEHSVVTLTDTNELKNDIDNYDMIFLDIMINNKNSIDWLYTQSYHHAQIVIMTAFPIEAYNISDIQCCYYLIKPKLTEDQLQKAIKKAFNNLTKSQQNIKLFTYGNINYPIETNNILYIESFNNNVVINMINGKKITIYSTLKEISNELEYNFLHCHKSYIINMNHISNYQPYKFCLSNNTEIPIPRKKYADIVNQYKNYIINF